MSAGWRGARVEPPAPSAKSAGSSREVRGVACEKYFTTIKRLIERIEATQMEGVHRAAQMVADVVAAGGVIHAFGAGHTHILVEEIWCRAGGIAAVSPILDPGMMPHTGPRKGSLLERLEGYGRLLFETHDAREGELVIVLSNSGRNATPLEIAMEARRRGLKVIAITSLDYSTRVSSRHSSGRRLFEVADLVIDNAGPMGDAAVEIEGLPMKVGPTTTITNALILNAIIVGATAILAGRGIEAPVFVSANLDLPADHNERIMRRYRDRVRLLD